MNLKIHDCHRSHDGEPIGEPVVGAADVTPTVVPVVEAPKKICLNSVDGKRLSATDGKTTVFSSGMLYAASGWEELNVPSSPTPETLVSVSKLIVSARLIEIRKSLSASCGLEQCQVVKFFESHFSLSLIHHGDIFFPLTGEEGALWARVRVSGGVMFLVYLHNQLHDYTELDPTEKEYLFVHKI